jgi:uncharacterized protein YqgC (DUF456 family)
MNMAFYVVFGLFALAMVGLGFMAVRWGVRRDRAARPPTVPEARGEGDR